MSPSRKTVVVVRGIRYALEASVLVTLLLCLVFVPLPAAADTAQYFYDDLGRLTGVADSTGTLGIYSYDAVGNLSAIQRFTPPGSGIGIYLVHPGAGATPQSVTIQGYGFDPTPGNNTVTFNGTAATVVSSTPFTLVATVPGGATTGTVSVTNTNGTATSPQPFTILTAATITAISPNSAVQGSVRLMTITGTNLSTATAVTFTQPGLSAAVLSGASVTSVPIAVSVAGAVPAGTYAFSVVTPQGTTASGAVMITVALPASNVSAAKAHLSVSMPQAPVPATSAPSGRTMTVTPPASAQMAYPSVPDTSAPTGRSMTVTPPTSASMP